jgi:hypothetical protein
MQHQNALHQVFSMKYTRERVLELVAAGIPAAFRDRIRVFL